MAILGKINLDWEMSEDGQSYFVTGRAAKEDGSIVEAETEIGVDIDVEAPTLYEGLFELCNMIFEDDIEECKSKGELDKTQNARLKRLAEIEDEFDEDEDEELIEAFFDIDQLNQLIEDLEDSAEEL